MLPPLILFDDDRGRFGPIGDLRAAFEIRSGVDSAVRRVARWAGGRLQALAVPARLREVVAERSTIPVNELPEGGALSLLNGRLLLPDDALAPAVGQALVEPDGDVVAATLSRRDAASFLAGGELPAGVERVPLPATPLSPRLARRPWDFLAALPRTIAHDNATDRPREAREPSPAVAVGDHPIAIHASARLWPGVVIDAEHGPVVVRERAVIRPHATLIGPCAVCEGAIVAEQAVIRPNSVVGPMCRVGGEVSGTIFQGFSNKSHDGFLGDSYVGKWVNLGAGTTNSNLLNTYGEVSMRLSPDGPRERSGRQFLGAILGDHAKLAIGTRLMTGTVVGTGAMIACGAPPPLLTPAFAWLTDDAAESGRRWRLDRFEETMRAVMKRRDREPGAAYLARIRELAEAAAAAPRESPSATLPR